MHARDDLSVQLAELFTAEGRAPEALKVLTGRTFQPWEGGEGRVLAAWEEAHLSVARLALAAGDADTAVEHATDALRPVPTLGEARHPLANTADLHLVLGDALAAAGDTVAARREWALAAAQHGDFQGMQVQLYSERTAAAVTALRRLGRLEDAQRLRDGLAAYVAEQAGSVRRSTTSRRRCRRPSCSRTTSRPPTTCAYGSSSRSWPSSTGANPRRSRSPTRSWPSTRSIPLPAPLPRFASSPGPWTPCSQERHDARRSRNTLAAPAPQGHRADGPAPRPPDVGESPSGDDRIEVTGTWLERGGNPWFPITGEIHYSRDPAQPVA